MALITCQECGNNVSDTARACPKCGFQIERNLTAKEEASIHNRAVVIGIIGGCVIAAYILIKDL